LIDVSPLIHTPMYAPEIEAQERRNERISAMITAAIMALLLLFSLFWQAFRMRVPPPGVKEYEVVGSIDFGNYKSGSRQVNNFQEAVANPTPAPTQSSSTSSANQAPATSSPAPSNEVTQPDLSPVSQPAPTPTSTPQPTPAPTTPTKPSPTPTPKPSPSPSESNSSSTSQKPTEELEFDLNSGGSNQGDSDSDVGNSGTPDVQVLDPKGLYSFAEGGEGGLEGRRPLSLPNPGYNSQEEGELTFEFVIISDGSVSYVKALPNNKPDLAEAGKAAIRKWRFNNKPGAPSQKVRVTIKFKLRG
jgi:outer membrane biosynthesis protein TonB